MESMESTNLKFNDFTNNTESCNLDSQSLFMRDAGKYRLLSEEETKGLLIKAHNGDIEAQDVLVKSNLRLVASTAKKYTGKGVSYMDLVQEGLRGVMVAIDKFSFDKNAKFSTYCYTWVTHYMGKSVQNDGRAIKISNHMQEDFAKVMDAKDKFCKDNIREPEFDELADILGGKFSTDYINEIFTIYRNTNVDSLDREVFEDTYLYDLVPDNSCYENNDQSYNAATKMLDSLDERSAYVLKSLFGCDGSKKLTIQAIAKKIGLSVEDVESIKANAFESIKHNFENPFSIAE